MIFWYSYRSRTYPVIIREACFCRRYQLIHEPTAGQCAKNKQLGSAELKRMHISQIHTHMHTLPYTHLYMHIHSHTYYSRIITEDGAEGMIPEALGIRSKIEFIRGS